MHKLLRKQLDRAVIVESDLTPAWRKFIAQVSRAYEEGDAGRCRLERSIALSAEEMGELARSLESERDRIRAIFDSAAVGVTQAGMDGRLIECNHTFARMVGLEREQLIGRKWLELVHPDDRNSTWAARSMVLPHPISLERRYTHSSGRTVWAHVTVSTVRDGNGEPLWNIATQRDMTEQRELEVSLRHAHKLEAVGRLAAGVAHEINTPLQFVGDNLAFLREALASLLAFRERAHALASPEQATALDAIDAELDIAFVTTEAAQAIAGASEGIGQMARIVRAMKVLAHRESDAQATLFDLNEAVQSVVVVARSETRYVADVELELAQIPMVLGYSDDLCQVFLNLLVNAAHAVADKKKRTGACGRIVVRTAQSGSDVLVTITDDGCGIPEAARSRIFEPFFTTKEVGRGTGQGLALARAIVVDKHRGELTFDSELGVGTTFRVRLPIAGPAARAA